MRGREISARAWQHRAGKPPAAWIVPIHAQGATKPARWLDRRNNPFHFCSMQLPPDESTRLIDFPWIVIRFRCHYCERGGDASLVACAVRHGSNVTLGELLARFTARCPWSPQSPERKPRKYGHKCGAFMPDIGRQGPPDHPPALTALRLIDGGKDDRLPAEPRNESAKRSGLVLRRIIRRLRQPVISAAAVRQNSPAAAKKLVRLLVHEGRQWIKIKLYQYFNDLMRCRPGHQFLARSRLGEPFR